MNWMQTVNTLIFVLGTFASVLESIHLANVWKQKLPEHTAVRLEQFARQAVQAVEQQYVKNPSKKQLAVALVVDLFQAFKLPVPPEAMIGAAIEAAVFLLPKTTIAELDTTAKLDPPK